MKIQRKLIGLTAVLALVAGSAAASEGLWLHVKVDGRDGETVRINLPLGLVEMAIPMIPDEHFDDGEFVLDDIHWGHGHHMSLADLRELWRELKSSPDTTFVTVEGPDETVVVSKQGDYLLVNAEERRDGKVEVRVPITVVDAFLSGEGERVDLRAAIEALAAHGEGELVAVSEDDEEVRVWIDRRSEAD